MTVLRLLAIPTLVEMLVAYIYVGHVLAQFLADLIQIRHDLPPHTDEMISQGREVVARYCTIPYLILLLPSLCVIWAIYDDLVAALLWTFILIRVAFYLWHDFKNRKNKKKRLAKALAVVREIGGRLRVTPVPHPA